MRIISLDESFRIWTSLIIPGLFNMSEPGEVLLVDGAALTLSEGPPLLIMLWRCHLPSIQIRAVQDSLTDIGIFSKFASIPAPIFLPF